MEQRMRRWPVVLVLFVLLALPAGARAQPAVDITLNDATPDFPETITFTLAAQSSQSITEAELEYGVDRRACSAVSSRAPIDLEPGMAISASWTWNMRAAGPLPPGTRVWWRWHLTLEDGTEERTEEQHLFFEDTGHAWQSITQQDITLSWYVGGPSFAEDLLHAGIEGLERLAADPQDILQGPVQVFVYNSSADLRDAVIFSPDWIGGRAYPSYNIILMAIPPSYIEYGQDTLRHELSHLVVHQMTFNCWGNQLPTWLDEGLAVYAEGEQPEYDDLVDDAIKNDELLTLRILSGSFPADGQAASLSYAQSYRVVRYLIDTYGRDQVLQLLDQIGDGVPIDRALEDLYGFDTDGLEAGWREAVGAKPRGLSTPTGPAATVTETASPTVAPTSIPTPGVTPSPEPVSMTLSYSPPGDLRGVPLVLAPLLAGEGTPASVPTGWLIGGIAAYAVALLLALLAWRRRLPIWPSVLVLAAAALLTAVYLRTHQDAQIYNAATEAFLESRWEKAQDGFDRALDAKPAFCRVNVPAALTNRAAASLNLGQAGDARADLEAALERDPGGPAAPLARTYLALWHCRYGSAGDALLLLDAALETQPALVPALALRAEMRWRLEDVEGAASDAESALAAIAQDGNPALGGAESAAQAVRGAARLVARDVKGALADAEKVLAHSGAPALAWAVRGGARLDQGQIAGAFADAETALSLEPGLPLGLAVRAGTLLAAGQPKEAARDSAASLEARPSLAWAHALRAAAAWQLHDADTATTEAHAALALDPQDTLARAVEAALVLSEHDLKAALEAADGVLASDSDQAIALAVRATVHVLRDRPAEALLDAGAALDAYPYLALAHATRAEAALNLGDEEAAGLAAGRALELDADLALAYATRAGVDLQRMEILAALDDAERAVALDPGLALGHMRQGAAYLALRRLPEAEASLERALALDGALAPALAYQAELALLRQDLAGALEFAGAALEINPGLALALSWQAMALDGMGRFEEAAAAADAAMALSGELPQVYLARASLSLRQGNTRQALAELDTALSLAPRYAPALQLRASVHLGEGDYAIAEAGADRAVAELPSVETYATRASLYQFLGRYEDALDDLDRAAELAPESALPDIVRVRISYALHETGAAEKEADEAIAGEPANPEAYLARAWLRRERRDFEAARQDVDEALAFNPWSVPALSLQASLEWSAGDAEAALAAADRAVALAPGDAGAWKARALIRLETGSAEQALADLDKAVDLQPGDPFLLLSRALAAAAADSTSPASDEIEQAVSLLPEHPSVHVGAAEAWLAVGEPEKAKDACDQALILDNNLAGAYLLRGEALLDQDEPSEAVQDLSRALRLDRTNPQGYALRAEAYLLQDRPDKAIEEAGAALELDVRTARAHRVMCQALTLQLELQEALESCNQAVDLAPGDGRAYAARGGLYLKLGDLDQALLDLNEAIRLEPDDLDAYLDRADAYSWQGRFSEAVLDVKRAQRRTDDPDLQSSLDAVILVLENTAMAHDGPATYSNDVLGFSLVYPEGWQAGPSLATGIGLYLQGPMHEGYRPVGSLFIASTTSRTAPELADETGRQMRLAFSQFSILEEQESQLGGEPAVLHICQAQQSLGVDMRLWFVYAVHRGEAWVFMFAAQSDRFSEAEPLFQGILDSFTFTG